MSDADKGLQDEISAEREASPKRQSTKRDRSPKKQRWLWLISAIILAIGGAALGCAIVLFPAEDTVTSPPGYWIQIDGLGHQLSLVHLEFRRGPGDTINIAASVGGSGSSNEEAVISIGLRGHATIVTCPHPISIPGCEDSAQYLDDWTFVGFPVPSATGLESMIIQDPSFGFTENSQTAYAELPYIYATATRRSSITFSISYNIPNASMYDWSVPPESTDSPLWNITTWYYELDVPATIPVALIQEPQGTEVTQGTEVIGLNKAAQATDGTDTLIAGVLLGIAGGAAIVAVQELLHLIIARQDERAE